MLTVSAPHRVTLNLFQGPSHRTRGPIGEKPGPAAPARPKFCLLSYMPRKWHSRAMSIARTHSLVGHPLKARRTDRFSCPMNSVNFVNFAPPGAARIRPA